MRTSETTSSPIAILPEHLIDQIKAGEVIERPAHLIKEILENAIDAQARTIHLHIVNEGMDLISLEDDGHGMSFDDLPFAFCRHATSKIAAFEDLYRLHTFGFRGEALASIAAVSKVTCVSTPQESHKTGGQIVLESGVVKSHTNHQGRRPGTTLYIKDLFYNTPARLKFIKSAQSEKNAIRKTIESFVISHPEITFSIRFDDEDKAIYTATEPKDYQKRIEQLFYPQKKKQKEQDLVVFEQEYEGHQVYGYFSRHSVRGTTKRKQFLFANERLFIDKQIHQLIIRSMESRGWHDGPGHYYLAIKAPPGQIDVNVHPNKTYIKFLKHSLVLSLISNNIKKSFGPVATEPTALHLHDHDPQQDSQYAPVSSGSTPLTNFIHRPFQSDLLGHNDSKTDQPHSLLKHDLYQLFCEQREEGRPVYLVHKQHLTAHLFSYLMSLNNDDESWQTPLLISEPFEVSSYPLTHDHLATLRQLGFMIDLVESTTYVLRSIPTLFLNLDIRPYAHHLLRAGVSIDQFAWHDYLYPDPFLAGLYQHSYFAPRLQNFALPLSSPALAQLFSPQ